MHFAVHKTKNFVGSRKFFYFVLLIVASQACWYAFNFQPSILDEGRHVGAMQYFLDNPNPFTAEQDEKWDHLGLMTRDSSYVYYYIMSLVLRISSVVTGNFMAQVVILRLLHTIIFITALYAYKKLFMLMGVKRYLVNLVLLFVALTPSISILAGVVSYDIPTFLLSGLILLCAVQILKYSTLDINRLLYFIALILFSILIKYTSLVFIVPVVAVLLLDVIKNNKLTIRKSDVMQAKAYLLVGLVLLFGVLITERLGRNYIDYGKPNADCIKILGNERCLKNYVQERNINALDAKPLDFKPKSHFNYFVQDWAPNMVRSQVRLNPWDTPVRVLHAAYFGAVILGTLLVALCFRQFWNQKDYRMLLITTAFFSLALFIKLYNSYASLGQVVATSSRYLLPVQPLFMMFVIVAADRVLNGYKYIKLAGLIILLLIFTQGGGILTYRMHAPHNLRWSEATQ